jgi:hypothetical protein
VSRVIPGESHAFHDGTLLVPPGSDEPAWIDTGLVPLIEALWAAGYETVSCCQDLGESIAALSPRRGAYWKGWAQIELPPVDACALAELAAAHGLTRHWSEPGAWEMSAPLVLLGARALLMTNLVQVRFPADQAVALTALVTMYGRQFREGR